MARLTRVKELPHELKKPDSVPKTILTNAVSDLIQLQEKFKIEKARLDKEAKKIEKERNLLLKEEETKRRIEILNHQRKELQERNTANQKIKKDIQESNYKVYTNHIILKD